MLNYRVARQKTLANQDDVLHHSAFNRGPIMHILVTAIALLVSVAANAEDLSSLRSCVKTGYEALKNRHAIVAAVLDDQKAEVLTFGAGSEDQLFEIGSITKTFTANLLAQAVVDGSLKLSDPIPVTYQKAGSTITYQHLTTHTSGIIAGIFPGFQSSNEFLPFDGLTIPLFKKLYAETLLESLPGAKINYSNMGISLLGLILSESASKPYEALVAEKIFRPLGMMNSYFEVPESQVRKFSAGLIVNDEGNFQEIPHWELYKTAIDPAGGIVSNIGDMIKYARANLDPVNSTLSESIALSHEPLVKYNDAGSWFGMNWVLKPSSGIVWHNGRTYGFNSILVASKRKGQAIVALTDTNYLRKNSEGKEDFDESLQNVAFECIK